MYSHDKFSLVNDVLRKCNEIKEAIKYPKKAVKHNT